MQRQNERSRMVAVGKRTDDGSACTLLAVSETGGVWALTEPPEPHPASPTDRHNQGASGSRVMSS